MNRVLELFLASLRFELTGAPVDPRLVEGMDAEQMRLLCELSATHDLSHIVYRSLKTSGLWPDADPHTPIMERAQHKAQYRYLLMETTLAAVRDAFDERRLSFVPLKGSVLRRLYPHPYLRVSCDIDLLVQKEDTEAACAVLAALGYEKRGASTHDISFYTPENVHIELHFSLTEAENPQPSDAILNRIFEYTIGEQTEKQLSAEAFYLYHIAHMAKHIMDGGCGVRPLIDLYVMRAFSYNEEIKRSLLAEASLITFSEVCEQLVDVWLLGGAHTAASASLAAYLLEGGAYGTLENSVRLTKARRGSRVRYLLSKMFLPFRVLARDYPVLRRHPYLFPFMQVVRWFRLLFSRDSRRVMETVRHSRADASDTAFSENIRMWGL